MTYIEIVNAVLKRLREDEVTTINDTTYSAMIGEFVNEMKREVEDSFDWVQLRTTIQITTAADTFRYTLSGAGTRYKILQVMDYTNESPIYKAPYKFMNEALLYNTDTGTPTYYDINGSTDGDPDVDLYPIPDGVHVINYNMIIPQADLSDEGDIITINSWPVILGTYARALSERGEEGTTSYAAAQMAYQKALGTAIMLGSSDTPDEMVWEIR